LSLKSEEDEGDYDIMTPMTILMPCCLMLAWPFRYQALLHQAGHLTSVSTPNIHGQDLRLCLCGCGIPCVCCRCLLGRCESNASSAPQVVVVMIMRMIIKAMIWMMVQIVIHRDNDDDDNHDNHTTLCGNMNPHHIPIPSS